MELFDLNKAKDEVIRVRVPATLKKALDKSAKKYGMDSSKLLRYIMAQFVIMSDEDQRAVFTYWKLKKKSDPEGTYLSQTDRGRPSAGTEAEG